MPSWKRQRGKYITKTAKITDGQIQQLLLNRGRVDIDFDERVYESLQQLSAASSKRLIWIIGAAAFGVLSHFGVLKSASSSGLEISPTIFNHAALLILSASTAAFCFTFCKQTYVQSWFSTKYKFGNSSEKAELLIKYPEAFLHFLYLPVSIGYPPFIFAKRRGYAQLGYIILVLIALAIFSVGSIALWLAIAVDVLHSTGVAAPITLETTVLSGILVILGWASPFYYDWPRTYTHYGMSQLLGRLDGQRLKRAHQRIAGAAIRMNLVESERKNGVS